MDLTEFQNCLVQKCIKNAIKQDKKQLIKQFSNNAITELNKVIEKLEWDNLTEEEREKRFNDFHQKRILEEIERDKKYLEWAKNNPVEV
tara:strand:- start:210 stop:476 length:267 start_codon:yes stop_codon:yes gene_type:complete